MYLCLVEAASCLSGWLRKKSNFCILGVRFAGFTGINDFAEGKIDKRPKNWNWITAYRGKL